MTSVKDGARAKVECRLSKAALPLPGGHTGQRLPAPRQAHSPCGYAGTYGYCSKFAVISPPDICARPGRRCPHFVLKWRYAEVPWLENRPCVQEPTSENLAQGLTALSSHHIEGGTIGILRDIFITIFGNDQNIVFTIPARSRLPIWNCDHGFHGNDHARL